MIRGRVCLCFYCNGSIRSPPFTFHSLTPPLIPPSPHSHFLDSRDSQLHCLFNCSYHYPFLMIAWMKCEKQIVMHSLRALPISHTPEGPVQLEFAQKGSSHRDRVTAEWLYALLQAALSYNLQFSPYECSFAYFASNAILFTWSLQWCPISRLCLLQRGKMLKSLTEFGQVDSEIIFGFKCCKRSLRRATGSGIEMVKDFRVIGICRRILGNVTDVDSWCQLIDDVSR